MIKNKYQKVQKRRLDMEKKDFSKMEAVVNRYVKAYREDFAIDKDILSQPTEIAIYGLCGVVERI